MKRDGSTREQDALYRLLIETVSDYAIFALDSEGRVLSWNPGAERFKGYTSDEIIGRHFSVFYPDEDIAAGKPDTELKVASKAGRFEDEGWRIRKNGSRFWANVVITALRDGDGKLVGFAKVTRDLTAHRAAEEQARNLAAETAAHATAEEKRQELEVLAQKLQEQGEELAAQNEEMQSLVEELEQANDDMQATLVEAEEAREVATEAERRERVGRARAELLQQLSAELAVAITPADVIAAVINRADNAFPQGARTVIALRNEVLDELELVQTSNMPQEALERWRHIPLSTTTPLTDAVRTGEPLFLESEKDWADLYPSLVPITDNRGLSARMALPLMAAGRSIGAMGVAFSEPRRFTPEDREFALTVAGLSAVALDRAQLFEAEKIARTAAESANMAKGEFLATMSHELRTPLNAIGGHVDLLAMEIHGPINDTQREALQRVKRAQLHLLGLITDLLNFARLERGKLEYRIESLVIQEVIADIAPMIEPQVASKGLTYDVHLPESPIKVVADREKLVQIILNLMSNSVKFTPTSGRIMVDIAERSDGTQPPNIVFLRVSDTGIGIPTDKLETIFDPFVQLSQGLAARRDGTGLGLSISRALARAMGGDLRARSIAGTSTTFTVTLPRASTT